MEREELLRVIMPCGCNCHTCPGSGEGVIAAHAKEMLRYLDGYDVFLEGHADHKIVSDAIRVLYFWSKQNCPGCRIGGENQCRYKDCEVRGCAKAHKVDFCYLCTSYPCAAISAHVKWREANDYMLQYGPQAFFEEDSQRSHYRYLKDNKDLPG